jgi:L-threonylcarbamoyladenylate synthase
MAVAIAREELLQDQPVIFPTDTVYGLIALSRSARAYRRIYELKGRSFDRPLALLSRPNPSLSGIYELLEGCEGVEGFKAGEVTAVVPPEMVPRLVDSTARIQPGNMGFRCPKHRHLRRLLDANRMLWATSVNRSGQPPAATADEVLAWLDELKAAGIDPPELVVLSRTPGSGRPSRVVDLTGDEPKWIR